ncbi:MAG: NAD-dependent succinate-semialdehyde dehydrogenase [Acidobacteriota bacterium]|nr:NAD-dependent succinate-semialdehyde dehydrogenase [Acidobacteriota bacterium]
MPIASINPATGETLRTFTPLSGPELESKLARAAAAFRSWRRTSFSDRAAKMLRAAALLESDKDALAALMTAEMGRPLRAAVDEPVKCAWACRYYAENAAAFLAPEEVATNAAHSSVQFQPLGPVLAVMPWNFPYWQVFRFAAPALMAGNVGLLKHASNVPQCALAIEDIFLRAGFPDGVFQTLLIESGRVPLILDDPRVVAATLTGSELAGAKVARQASGHIKKTVLELGGSDPFIVMPTADLDSTARLAVKARTVNGGQSCIAAKRFIVHAAVYEDFTRLFVEAMRALKVGDPMDPATDVGPMATSQIIHDLETQVRRASAAGARILTGGKRINRDGWFFEPTILEGVPRDCPVYREEIFGPVAMLFRVPDIDGAVRLANDTAFGLGASAWTGDAKEQRRFIDELEAGQVFINGVVASDPRLPFGGIKHSGYGRELGSFGIREFVNAKTVWIK